MRGRGDKRRLVRSEEVNEMHISGTTQKIIQINDGERDLRIT